MAFLLPETEWVANAGNLADLLYRLGDIPAKRILINPPPGTATERHALAFLEGADKRLAELVDGVLVEKPMGWKESLLASLVVKYLWVYLDKHDIGIALTADGPVRLRPKRIRTPDVCFVSWDRIPADAEKQRVLRAIPNLAVEVFSTGNTRREIDIKVLEYFKVGVELVWVIYPKTESATVYQSPTDKRKIAADGKLDGDAVLPGFSLPLKKLFARRGGRRMVGVDGSKIVNRLWSWRPWRSQVVKGHATSPGLTAHQSSSWPIHLISSFSINWPWAQLPFIFLLHCSPSLPAKPCWSFSS